MKRRRMLFCMLTFVALLSAAPLMAADAPKTNPQFEAMKALVGDWVGKTPYGKSTVTYKLVSDGSTLMETMGENTGEMVTMYHADGDSVMMTHYCSANNQPRMRAKQPEKDGSLVFKFIDVTNLANQDEVFISGLSLKIIDKDHFTQQWTHREKGKETSGTFTYERKK